MFGCNRHGAFGGPINAETFFMRLARGSGVNGLAAMSGKTSIAYGAGPAVPLLRPLLANSRAELTRPLIAYGQDFLDDPSNDDPAFERIRTRALLGALEENGLLPEKALCRSAQRLSAAARAIRDYEDLLFQNLWTAHFMIGAAPPLIAFLGKMQALD